MYGLTHAELEQLAPDWKIKSVRNNVRKPSIEKRHEQMKKASWNATNQKCMDGEALYLVLQDGSNSALSAEQMGALYNGDEAYAGAKDFYTLEKAVLDSLGYSEVVPMHTYPAAMHIFNNIATRQHGSVVLCNGRGVNSLCYIVENKVIREKHFVNKFAKMKSVQTSQPSSPFFRGDVDLELLEKEIKAATPEKVAYVFIQMNNEGVGAGNGNGPCANEQPISLENLEKVKEITTRYGVPLILDASNIYGNAFVIREQNKEFSEKKTPLIEIVKKIVALSDGALISGSQEFLTNTGACVAFNKTNVSIQRDLFRLTQAEVVEYEGLHTYGGMAGRDMGVMAVGIREASRDSHMRQRVAQVRFLAKMLKQEGVPIAEPVGTGAVFIDADKFVPHLPAETRSYSLAVAIYMASGILTKPLQFAHNAAVRVFVPPRTFTCNHIAFIAKAIGEVYKARESIVAVKECCCCSPCQCECKCKCECESKCKCECSQEKEEEEDEDEEDCCAVCSMMDVLREFVPQDENALLEFARKVDAQLDTRPVEPYVIRHVEHTSEKTREQRKEGLERAGYNTFLLRMEDGVKIDILTDSGTNAQSMEQWAEINRAIEVGGNKYRGVIKAVQEVYGFEFVIPTHQGRMAEFLLSQSLIQEGDIITGNMYFTTTKFHQEFAGATFYDIIIDEAHSASNPHPYKGNIDIKKLEALIEKQIAKYGVPKMPYVAMAGPVNMAGGQPFSMDNLKEVRQLLDKYNAKYDAQGQTIRLVFDATRAVENCEMIRERDPAYANKPIGELLKEICSYFDAATMSGKKDNLINIGGWLAIRDKPCNKGMYEKCMKYSVLFDGTGGDTGLGERNLAAIEVGIREMIDEEYMHCRLEQVRKLGRALQEEKVPIVLPIGGHGIFIDAVEFLKDENGNELIPKTQYKSQSLAAAIFEVSGLRSMERGAVSAGRDHDGNEIFPHLELVRLTIPRRVYLDEQLVLAAKQIGELYRNNKSIKGLKMVYEPKALRFFQARFVTVDK